MKVWINSCSWHWKWPEGPIHSYQCLALVCSPLPALEWINWLWPSDAIWQHRSGSTLAQVMAWCLTAPNHYLNQCWLIISRVLWPSSEGVTIRRSENTNLSSKMKNCIFKIASRSPRGQWVKEVLIGVQQASASNPIIWGESMDGHYIPLFLCGF